MTHEIFVDGICELDDKTLQGYFSRFGARIASFDVHRHRPTNSCCFALISFQTPYTVNAILRHRPHSINLHLLFVKRLLPSNLCSFIERLLPVTSLFVFNTSMKEFDEDTLQKYFKSYGNIVKFERDYGRDRILIEYEDYDSVDLVFLNKDNLPSDLEIHKNILPRAQSTIIYHGTCRQAQQQQQQSIVDETKKKRHRKTKESSRDYPADREYQDLLQRTIENLAQAKAQLKNKENAYAILQIEYAMINDENEKLTKLLSSTRHIMNTSFHSDLTSPSDQPCMSCKEHEMNFAEQTRAMTELKDQYDAIKSQYQRLLLIRYTPTISFNSGQFMTQSNASFSQRDISPKFTSSLHQQLVEDTVYQPIDNAHEYEEDKIDLSQSDLPTPGFCDIATKQRSSPSSLTRIRMQYQRVPYKYNSVTCDEE